MTRILVIDDDEQIRTFLKRALEHAGYGVQEAKNGEEGLRLYREQPSDLVITDLIMPEKEGLETIGELKRNYPGIKIIAISGGGKHVKMDFLPIAEKLGADVALAKPFSVKELLEAVKKLTQ